MKSYFKSITKSLYQKVERVVQDEYIQPVTQNQVYGIINRKRTFSNHAGRNNKSILNRSDSNSQELLHNIERLTLVTPQREFNLIGQNYSFQVINYRLKQLKSKNQAVKQHMLSTYSQNLQCIEMALMKIQDIKNLTSSKQKSHLLKLKIQKLRALVEKTMKITKLNIKLKNIKDVLKIAQKIPNVKKMSLFELKNINTDQVQQFKRSIHILNPLSNEQNLKCIQHLQFFIDKASSEHLRVIINSITECINGNFQNLKYQKAIKDFIISKNEIDFQKLLIRLVQAQIRDKIQQQINKSQNKNALYLRCQTYITILINIFKIFRWHRYNSAATDISENVSQKIRQRNHSVVSNCSDKSQEKYPAINLNCQISIKINIEEIKVHVCGLMDQCLKQQIQQIIFIDSIKNQEIFELLVLINRFYQIAYSFSSYVFSQNKNLIKEILMRKCYKLQEKGIKEFNQALNMEEGNQWNRLPVLKSFRHKNLEKSIQKMKRLFLYDKIPSLASLNFKFLNLDYTSENQESFQLQVVQKKEQTFELCEFRFPHQKFQKMLSFEVSDCQLPEHEDPQVVLCQSSITILNYFEHFISMYFYFPIQEIRNDILDKMSFYVEYYIYYIFETFLSDMYKQFFFHTYETVEQNYLQVRTQSIYENLFKFLTNFNSKRQNHDAHNGDSKQRRRKMSIQLNKYRTRGFNFIKKDIKESKVTQQNMVKARAMATDSVKFILAYFKNILTQMQKFTSQTNQNTDLRDKNTHKNRKDGQISLYLLKIEQYKKLQFQISDLLLTDIVPATTKIDFVVPIMKKIKWHEIQNSKQIFEYGTLILKNIKDTYDKMKSMSKGQIPYYLVDKIFSFYWKTQLTYMTKAFLDEHIAHKQKGGKTSKLAFEKLIDILYQGLVEFLQERYRNKQANSSKLISYEYSQKRIQLLKASYLKIKNIFPIIFQSNWPKCRQILHQTIKSYEFIYKIQICIMKASESCSGLNAHEIEQRQNHIDEFIRTQILK